MGPPWFRLLDQYQREGHFGLTPSFLVGALRTPPGAVLDLQTSLAEFRALLESMSDETPSRFHVRIAQCPRLRQPIAALISTTAAAGSSLGEPIATHGGLPPKLYAWPEYFADDSRDVGSLGRALWVVFGTPICEGRFSYRDGAFQLFDASDLEFIQRALEREEDV